MDAKSLNVPGFCIRINDSDSEIDGRSGEWNAGQTGRTRTLRARLPGRLLLRFGKGIDEIVIVVGVTEPVWRRLSEICKKELFIKFV